MEQQNETKYNWWLVSNSFLKRATAVFLYNSLFWFIISAVIFVIMLILWVSFYSIFNLKYELPTPKNHMLEENISPEIL